MRSFFVLFCSLLFVAHFTCAQTKNNLPLSADSLATANYRDVFVNFFQLAINKITGPQKEIMFTSNPFAVMAKTDPVLLRDQNYVHYRHLRDLNFSFAAKLDSQYRFNGFSSGLTYALINRRDETVSQLFIAGVLQDTTIASLQKLNLGLELYISSLSGDTISQNKIRKQKTEFFKGDKNFASLDKSFQEKIIQLAVENRLFGLQTLLRENPDLNIRSTAATVYTSWRERINNKLLWTLGIADTTYSNQFMFSNIVVATNVVKGINKLRNQDIELNMRGALQFTDDSTKTGRDLQRSILSVEPALNFVLKNKFTQKSIFEFKLGGSYYHNFNSIYKNERKDVLVLNGTLRVRVYNDIWVPIDIKYDPKSGNLFGFINVRANFSALRNIAGSLLH